MTLRLENKRIFITAAAQGIGRACAEACAREGAFVIASDIDQAKLADLAREANITPGVLNVRDADAIREVAATVGTIDVLLNVAGFVHSGTVLTATEDEWDFAFDLNVRSMFRLTRAFLPGMIANGGGSIINIASVVGFAGVPNRFIYSTTKAAVIGMTKSIAADFVKQGIRCNAICPGTVQSPSLEDRLHEHGDYDKARAAFIARQPMGRLGRPEEIAELAVYLASDAAAFTTGQCHVIDGGMTM